MLTFGICIGLRSSIINGDCVDSVEYSSFKMDHIPPQSNLSYCYTYFGSISTFFIPRFENVAT